MLSSVGDIPGCSPGLVHRAPCGDLLTRQEWVLEVTQVLFLGEICSGPCWLHRGHCRIDPASPDRPLLSGMKRVNVKTPQPNRPGFSFSCLWSPVLADARQGSSSARDPEQALAMEMRVGAVETAGPAGRGGASPESPPQLGAWEEGYIRPVPRRCMTFRDSKTVSQIPGAAEIGQSGSGPPEHACQKVFQKFLPIVASFHK